MIPLPIPLLFLLLLRLLLLLLPISASTNFITNSNFEITDSNDPGFGYNTDLVIQNGLANLFVTPSKSLSQTISGLTLGQTMLLTIDYSASPGYIVSVIMDDVDLGTLSIGSSQSTILSFTPTSTTATLQMTLASPGTRGSALIASLSLIIDVEEESNPEGGAHGDPQFAGFQGQSYQIHGIPDAWFNTISSPHLYMNTHFAYLATGNCLYNNTQCWSHPGTYIDDIGISIICNNETNATQIRVVSGEHAVGIKRFTIDDQHVPVGIHRVALCDGTVSLSHPLANRVTISTSLFEIVIVNSDNFFNLQTVLLDRRLLTAGHKKHTFRVDPDIDTIAAVSDPYPHHIFVHGLLGQTWKNAVYGDGMGMYHAYQGQVEDYVTQGPFDITSSSYAQPRVKLPTSN